MNHGCLLPVVLGPEKTNGKINFCGLAPKAYFVIATILLLQLFYISVLTRIDYKNILTLLVVGCIGFLLLRIILKGSKNWRLQRFESKIFIFLFFLSAASTFFFSRFEYITSTINQGLEATRLDESLGAGGWYSPLNSMFYPLALLSVFYKKNRWEYHAFFFFTLLICAIDLLFIGTRNSVFFVLFFRFLFSESNSKKKYNIRYYLYLVIISLFLFFAFEYTTRERSGFEGLPVEYWMWKSVNSEAMASSVVNVDVYNYFGDISYFFLVFFYICSYISHSVPEFLVFIENFNNWLGSLAHLRLYFSAFTFQDTSYLNDYVATLRYHSGYYQTLYASLIVDFGLYIFFLPFAAVLMYGRKKYLVLKIYLVPVLILSPIENYLYTGLTPLRFFIFLICGSYFFYLNTTLSKRIKLCISKSV